MTGRLFALAAVLLGCGGSTAPEASVDAAVSDSSAVSDTTTETSTSDASCPCIAAPLEWEENGGLVAYVDRSAVSGCNTYTQKRADRGGTTSASCSVELDRCPTDAGVVRYEVPELNARLADPDVRAAVAAAPVLYGRDTRPVDGSLLQVKIGGKLLEIGEDCGTSSGCTPVPRGVGWLRDALREADRLREHSVACAALR